MSDMLQLVVTQPTKTHVLSERVNLWGWLAASRQAEAYRTSYKLTEIFGRASFT